MDIHDSSFPTKICPLFTHALLQNLAIYIANGKIVREWKYRLFTKNATTMHNHEEFIIRRLSMINTTDQNLLSNDAVKEYLFHHTPVAYINCRRAHVDASTLQSHKEPSNLREHSLILLNDKTIWVRVYLHEYIGFTEDTSTWEYITEAQYQAICPIVGNTLPSIALSTIKRNEHGNPYELNIVSWHLVT